MLCQVCKEQIEVGEACVPEVWGSHHRFFHTGCFRRFKEEAKQEDEAFQHVLDLQPKKAE